MRNSMTTTLLPAIATIINVVPFAMLTPLVVIQLSNGGKSATTVGVYGTAPIAAILAMSLLTPKALSYFGPHICHFVGLALASASLAVTAGLLMVNSETLMFYMGLALANGVAAALTWTATETLIATQTQANRIGCVTALYQLGLGIAFTIGPFLPFVFSPDPETVLLITLVLMSVAVSVALTSQRNGTSLTTDTSRTGLGKSELISSCSILVAAFAGGVFEVGLNSMLPHIGLQLELLPSMAAALVGVVALGALVAQLPAGWFADKGKLKQATYASSQLVLLGLCALAIAANLRDLVWIAAGLIGAGGGALYTLAIIRVAQWRDYLPVAALTSLTIAAYTLGAAFGPLLAGLIIDSAGLNALCVCFALLASFVLITSKFSRSPSQKEI